MDSLIGYFTTISNSIQVILGLTVVILLHELGHFLLAKWNDVKVERFSIGFPPNILKFKKGETEYVLGAVPLGGYVSLFGEGPDEDGSKSTDPRAFPNKSVGARMAIMSAGVVMNLFLGLGCFIYAYGQGIVEQAAKIGAVVPGSPAYIAGILPGDEVISIDGRRDLNYHVLTSKILLSPVGKTFHFELKRPGHEGLVALDIQSRREGDAKVRTIGVIQQDGLILNAYPFRLPAGMSPAPTLHNAGFKAGDVIVAAGVDGQEPKTISDSIELHRFMLEHGSKPVDIVVNRNRKGENATSTSAADLERVTVTLPPARFVDFGFRLQIEPVSAIRTGSIADKAGFHVGDLIVKVDGSDTFDPMRLPTLCYEKAGKPMVVEVERRETSGDVKKLELTVTPDASLPWGFHSYPAHVPLDVPGIGIAFPVRTKIVGVTPDSPAEKAGLKIGDVINALTIPLEKEESKLGSPLEIKFDDTKLNWASAFQILQGFSKRAVFLTVNHSTKPISIVPEPVDDWYCPSRGELLPGLLFKLPPMGPVDAIRHGFDETVDNILNIYATLRGLVSRTVPMTGLAGPITIFRVAYSMADSGLAELIRFLGILSINLAVLNFLPIPPLDGGQMVYLLAEGVRGRPIPDSAKFTTFWIGVILVLSLMGYVLVQDVLRW